MQPSNIAIKDYTYTLPNERIARYPLERRDESKLLVYNQGVISQNIFYHLSDFIPPNGLFVVNNTKVVQARLLFKKETGALIEIFCLEPLDGTFETIFSKTQSCRWKCIVGNLKRWKDGSLVLTNNELSLTATKINDHADWQEIEFSWTPDSTCFSEILNTFGHIPIPPYLGRDDEDIDKSRYQTIFSAQRFRSCPHCWFAYYSCCYRKARD